MKLKQFAKLILPPILIQSGKALLNFRRNSAEWEYIPEGWEYQNQHPEVKGWNVSEILSVYQRKWPVFSRLLEGTGPLGISHESDLEDNQDLHHHNMVMTFAYVLARSTHQKSDLTMLDWGGGVGHFYRLAQVLMPNVCIHYHCKDTPLLVEYGRQLFPDQQFYTDDSCLANSYDLVLACTSMHYSQDWKGLLAGFSRATNGFLYISHLPVVVDSPSFVYIQRPYSFGYNTQYLSWCFNEREFLAEAEKNHLELQREFVYGHTLPIYKAPEQSMYRGYLFRR